MARRATRPRTSALSRPRRRAVDRLVGGRVILPFAVHLHRRRPRARRDRSKIRFGNESAAVLHGVLSPTRRRCSAEAQSWQNAKHPVNRARRPDPVADRPERSKSESSAGTKHGARRVVPVRSDEARTGYVFFGFRHAGTLSCSFLARSVGTAANAVSFVYRFFAGHLVRRPRPRSVVTKWVVEPPPAPLV